jgi:hypothetical protein
VAGVAKVVISIPRSLRRASNQIGSRQSGFLP